MKVLKTLRILLNLYPIFLIRSFFITLLFLFTTSTLLFTFKYSITVWHFTFEEALRNYFFYALPPTIFIILIFNSLFLKKISISSCVFFTRYLTTGHLPSKISQFNRGIFFFKNIFSNFKRYKIIYKSFLANLRKKSLIFYFFNFEPLFISYCTARNTNDIKSSGNFLELYLKIYPFFFLFRKMLFTILRVLLVFLSTISMVFITVEILPNFLFLPKHYQVHLIIGIITGVSIYKLFFADLLLSLEIVSMLKFLSKKNLPGSFNEEAS